MSHYHLGTTNHEGHPLSMYATGGGGVGVGVIIENAYSCVMGDGGCYTLSASKHFYHLFSCFWQHVCLMMSCNVCRNLTLPSFK